MRRSLTLIGLMTSVALAYACGSDDQQGGTSTGSGASTASGGGGSGSGGDGGAGAGFTGTGGGSGGSNPSCEPPDLLIVLDRTMSMHRQPNGDPAPLNDLAASKWWIAIEAIEAATASFDQGIRFGLELFPLDPGANQCVTLEERIQGITATNTPCEQGEVPVSPALGTGAFIANTLDAVTTRLCTSTPIGAGLQTANTTLAGIQEDGREQYALLITDGQDTCDDALPISEAQAMAAAGVRTFVVGFDASQGTGVDPQQLNDMACAGRTASGFPASCIDDGSGNYTWDPNGSPIVYIVAEDAQSLDTALSTIAAEVCCDCIQ